MGSKAHEAFSYKDIYAELDQYVSSVIVSEDDPAFIISWNLTTLKSFVQVANTTPDPPDWLTFPPNMTPASLAYDIMSHLEKHAGGRCGNVMLAPNNIVQYGNILTVLRDVESESFIQRCMRKLPAGSILAQTFVLTKKRLTHAIRTNRVVPTYRLCAVFQ
ncbi:hypothetical protein Ae201684P_013847 [Aphanomyces euteiches]|nr:hypothetical protein Ae201684P_013847 [Aphanomyces euteiches]